MRFPSDVSGKKTSPAAAGQKKTPPVATLARVWQLDISSDAGSWLGRYNYTGHTDFAARGGQAGGGTHPRAQPPRISGLVVTAQRAAVCTRTVILVLLIFSRTTIIFARAKIGSNCQSVLP